MKADFTFVRCSGTQLTYETRNADNEKIYYCIMEDSVGEVHLYRCSQPFTENHETFYEPSHVGKPNRRITFNRPNESANYSVKLIQWMENHEFIELVGPMTDGEIDQKQKWIEKGWR